MKITQRLPAFNRDWTTHSPITPVRRAIHFHWSKEDSLQHPVLLVAVEAGIPANALNEMEGDIEEDGVADDDM